MPWQGLLQFIVLLVLLRVTVPPIGRYLAHVYDTDGAVESLRTDTSRPLFGDRFFSSIERRIYRIIGVDENREQRWNVYTMALLAFSATSFFAVYGLQRAQSVLPFNPTDRPAVSPWGAFNTSVSFVTNTNWQWYSGEQTMSHLTQMLGLTVQNFVSAGAGMAVVVALIRGITRSGTRHLGNFWVDLTRTITRVLLPMSLLIAVLFMSQGVIQNFRGNTPATTVETTAQMIPGGPVASQIAIKQLGSNGGGFFNANGAHPFENPNGWTNLISIWAIAVLPFAMVVAFGILVKDKRQSRVVMVVMAGLFVAFSAFTMLAEQAGNPRLTTLGVDQSISSSQTGGNLEGKEVRFGAASCGLWAGATTGTSNGSVNCTHDSFTPLGGLAPMVHMMLGEISPGGVGVGLMGLLVYALLAVFIAGLMVGRTPEYMGKKIQAAEMKLVTLYILAVPTALLGFSAASVLLGSARTFQSGPHGLSEVLYNYASTTNNNGSAFAYMGTGSQWYTVTMGVSMLVGRFLLIIPALAIGASLAGKPRVPETAGTLPTHTPLFSGLIVGVIVIVAGLTYFPALALGPILEHLTR
jgi:potassium-transporting ATPase potassium-binding subunit